MIPLCCKGASQGSAKVCLPRNGTMPGQDTVKHATKQDQDDDGNQHSPPAFHKKACDNEIGGKPENDSAGADMHGISTSYEPGTQAAYGPNDE